MMIVIFFYDLCDNDGDGDNDSMVSLNATVHNVISSTKPKRKKKNIKNAIYHSNDDDDDSSSSSDSSDKTWISKRQQQCEKSTFNSCSAGKGQLSLALLSHTMDNCQKEEQHDDYDEVYADNKEEITNNDHNSVNYFFVT